MGFCISLFLLAILDLMSLFDPIISVESSGHPLKALFPIEVTEGGIIICASDVHPSKAEFPIEVTEEGIVICVNDEHPEKAEFPISVTEDGIVICVNDEHFLNMLSYIFCIVPLIINDLIP